MNKANEVIEFWANLKPDNLAFADDGHEISFRDLDSLTRKIAFLIKEQGIKRGDLVALILPGYPGWLISLTLSRLGIPTLMQNNLNHFLPELLPNWVISLDPHPDLGPEKTIIADKDFLTRATAGLELDVFGGFLNPSDITTFYSTSGTNGETKYQAVGAEQMWSDALQVHSSSGFGEDDVFMLLPFGAAWTTLHFVTCLILGKTYYNCKYADYRLPKFISKYPIRTIIGSPIQISGFLSSQDESQVDLPNLGTVIMGGSPPSQQLVQRIKAQLNCNIFNAYGSTEAGLIAMSTLGTAEAEGAWINPPFDLQIVDDNDQILPAVSIGHIRYRKENMLTEYYKNPQATAQFFRGGYFYPGDLGFLDNQGRLHLEGRSSDVLNLGGVKINPERIEAAALAAPGVRDCGAYSFLGPSGVEELHLALVVDSNFDHKLFEQTMEKSFPKLIRGAKLVSLVPRNETGKIQRNLLAR